VRSRNSAIAHSPRYSPIQWCGARRSFATPMISAGVVSAGATSISKPACSSPSGRSRPHEEAPLLPQTVEPFDRLYQILRSASSKWSIFPTLHWPTLSRTVRTRFADAGYDTEEVEKAIDEHDWLAFYRTHEFVLPAPTTNGGRTVMHQVCDEAEIILDGEHDYLTPHGGLSTPRTEIGATEERLHRRSLRL